MKTKFTGIAVLAIVIGLGACSKSEAQKSESASAGTQVAGSRTANPVDRAWAATEITHVDAKRAADLLGANPDVTVLDIRTPREFATGHIKNAVNINFFDGDFAQQLSRLDPSKDYLVHCRSGGRSTKSLKIFKKLGFKHIYHLDGGMNAWNRAGLPTVK